MSSLPMQAMLMLAWRNLWRNHRRTLIMLTAITVGVWAMIFMTALLRGMVDDMLLNGIRSLPGEVQIHHTEYRDDPSINNSMPPPGDALVRALQIPEVAAWTSRVRVPAVISSERDSRGVILLGIEPDSEVQISFDVDTITEGRFLEDSNDRGLVIGAKMADHLETELGKRVVVMSQDPDNNIADRGFRIVGIYKAKLPSLEETYIYAGRQTVQAMLKLQDRVSEIAITGEDYRHVDKWYPRIKQAAGEGVETLPWFELDKYLGSMLPVMDGFVLVWIIVVFLALSFGLVNTLVMAVFERVREIGLMMALGMRPGVILYQILMESLLLLLIGLLLGNVIAVATVIPLQDGINISVVAEGMEMMGTSSILYPALKLNDMITANVIVIVLGLLTSILPAWRAARYDPIEALNKT
ncbi:MAG: ABC transporter permease [Gammaproteobacteria bacterium]|jgi:ABC-type lipoprotein release transport system permease subunit